MSRRLFGRRKPLPLVLAMLVGNCLLTPPALSQTSLKVISYNIQGMAPGSDPTARLVHIIENLEALDPDIIGFQEINETRGGDGSDNQGRAIVDSLSDHFGRPYYYYQYETQIAWYGAYTQFNGIISKYPMLDSGFVDLPASDFPRKVIWANVETPFGSLNFFDTHLSTDIAFEQAQVIVQYIRAREHAHPGAASILTGDFNSTPQSDAIQYLVGDRSDTTFADTYAEANPATAGFTVPAGDANARIDYIFYGRAGDFRISASEVVFTAPFAANQYCSDHFGVMTTFVGTLNRRLSAPGACDFPSLLPGMQYSRNLTLAGAGNVAVDVASIANSNPAFEISGLPQFPVTLTRGGPGLTLTVTFVPQEAGLFTDTIQVTSNDSVDPHREIALRGNCIAAVEPAMAGQMYAASLRASEGALYALDPTNGATSMLGSLRMPGVHSITVRPSTHELYGAFGGSDSTWLYRITANTGDAVPALTLGRGNIGAIAFGANDVLYGATTRGELFRIDVTEGTTTAVGSSFKHGFAGICMNPSGTTLWASLKSEVDTTYQIDPVTGEVRYVGVTGFSAFTRSLAFAIDGTLYALLDNGYGETYIATLDTTNASGVSANLTSVAGLSAIALRPASGSSSSGSRPSAFPAVSALSQNYPNPFNPRTTVGYTVAGFRGRGPGLSEVRLVVYDLLGRVVEVLVDEQKPPGRYSVVFDGSKLASGAYFCRFSVGTYSASQLMILQR